MSMRTHLLFLAFAVLPRFVVVFSNASPVNCSHSFHRPDLVREAADIAIKLMESKQSQEYRSIPLAKRLLVMMLFSTDLEDDANTPTRMKKRIDYLKCSLKNVKNHLASTTPADVFIWTRSNTIPPSWFTAAEYPNMYFMHIHDDLWKIPCNLIPKANWTMSDSFDEGFYLMGRWRLTFSFDFGREMGYKYRLQLDDDAIIVHPIHYNLVNRMSEQNILMTALSRHYQEHYDAAYGLPELTKYWLDVNKFKPSGPIQRKFLTSDTWDRAVSVGYFIIFDVDFWFLESVQSYLMAVMRSGGDFEHRWQEQAVMGMIRQLFIQQNQVWLEHFADHNRHDPKNFKKWCTHSI